MSDEDRSQIMNLGSRMHIAEQKLDLVSKEVNQQGLSIAAMRVQVSSEHDLLKEIRDCQRKIEASFTQHLIDDARSAKKMLIGTVAAIFTGLSTLGVLIWAVMDRLHFP